MSCSHWSGRGDLNARPPAPKTLDPLICASIDSTTCRLCVLGLVETLATIWTANLQFGLPNHRQNQPEVLLEVPIAKYNQRGRAPAVAAVGRSVVERLADPSYNRDFGQVPGHFPERRFHGPDPRWRLDGGRSRMVALAVLALRWELIGPPPPDLSIPPLVI